MHYSNTTCAIWWTTAPSQSSLNTLMYSLFNYLPLLIELSQGEPVCGILKQIAHDSDETVFICNKSKLK